MFYLILYISCIFGVNYGFTVVPPIDLGFGVFSPMALVVGIIFVARDYAQRAVGHYVLVGMLIGVLISYYGADPAIAWASALSFAISETVDWLVFTVTGKPFYTRVLLSTAIATPVDTAVFLAMIDFMNPATFVLMVIAKILASLLIYAYGNGKIYFKSSDSNLAGH